MQAMTNKNAKTFFFASLIAAMVLPFAMMDYADAACSECGDPNSLRVKADYETVGWWSTNHHLADDWTYVKAGQTKSSTTTATQSESGYVYPSFLIKSNSLDSKTASYEVTYEFYDATQGLKGTDPGYTTTWNLVAT